MGHPIKQLAFMLLPVRDIALMPALAADFETHPPFRNGMMRTNGAQRSIRFGATWVRGEEAHVEPAFTYSKLIGGDIPTTSRFDLDPTDKLPGRIAAIIGRNAVGKTFFLSQLAADLSQIDRISEERLTLKEQRFPDGRTDCSQAWFSTDRWIANKRPFRFAGTELLNVGSWVEALKQS